MGKNSKFTGGFSWNCFMWHSFFDITFDLHISSIFRFVVLQRVARLVLFVSNAATDDSPVRTLRSSLLSPSLPPPFVQANSFPNSGVTDEYWFSSISPFAMFPKSINNSLSTTRYEVSENNFRFDESAIQ